MSSSGPFHMSNSYGGPRYQLQVDPSSGGRLELYMTVSSGLLWTLNSTSDANKVNICTTYGDSHSEYCLDIWGDNKTLPHLADPDIVSGQQWTRNVDSSNYVRLSNDFTGSGWYLDITPDTLRATMAQGSTSGQQWRFDAVSTSSTTKSASATATSSSSSSATQTASGASSATPTSGVLGTNTAASGAESSAPASNGLDTSAKIGIGVGVGLGVPLIALIVLLVFFRKRVFGRKTGPEMSALEKSGPGYEAQGYQGPHEKSAFTQTSRSGPTELFTPPQYHELGEARSPGGTTELPCH